MEIHIKTLKITLAIAVITLCLALLMGAEIFKDASQSYLCGISWSTWQDILLGISGGAILTALTSWIVYYFQIENYLDNCEKYLVQVSVSAKSAFIQIQEASKVLENGILSDEEKPLFKSISDIIDHIGDEQNKIQPHSNSFLLKHSKLVSYNALLCGCYKSAQEVVAANYDLKIKHGNWGISDTTRSLKQLKTGSGSRLLDEAKKCAEEELRLTVNKLSWQINNVIIQTNFAIQQLYLLRKKQDQLQSICQWIDEQASYFQKNIDVKAPMIDKRTIAEHQIKIIENVSEIEGILSEPNGPAIAILGPNLLSYVNNLRDVLRRFRGSQLEVSILYAYDKKLNFDIRKIVELFDRVIEHLQATISLTPSLSEEWVSCMASQGIDVNTVYKNDPKLVELTVEFLREKTPYGMMESSIDEILKIIRSDDFKGRLNFGGYQGASNEK